MRRNTPCCFMLQKLKIRTNLKGHLVHIIIDFTYIRYPSGIVSIYPSSDSITVADLLLCG